MEFDKHFGERKKEEPLTTILVGKFDARKEIDRIIRELRMTMIYSLQSNLIRKPEKEARIAKEEYNRDLAQIHLAEQKYLERLEQAKKSGAIDNEDYFRARFDILGGFSPFERMRTEARETYRDVVKFD